MTASKTCAVQILLVAFSRRMCCSRVCNAMRRASCPCRSCETPINLPGSDLFKVSRVARKAACGPPYPMGTPKRWALPKTISAPISPGGLRSVRLSKSVATATKTPCWCMASIHSDQSLITPKVLGNGNKAPK